MMRIPDVGQRSMWWRHRGIILGVALLAALILPVVRYFDHHDVAHQAIQVWLRLYGDAIYEYRSITGKLPSQIDDLAKTSLPKRFPYWKQVLDDETIVDRLAQEPETRSQRQRGADPGLSQQGALCPTGSRLGLLGRLANGIHQEGRSASQVTETS